MAPNLIKHVLLELSTLCRWKETCDIVCWGLRQPLSEYSCFLPNWCPEIVWWKLTVFRSLVRNHCQASDLHCITFNWRPSDMTSCKPIANLCLNCYFWDLFDFIEKLFEMACRRNDSIVEDSKSHHTCFAWTLYPLSVKETCDIECWGLRQPLSESSCFLPTRCPEIVWWKLTVFHYLVQIQCQDSDLHCITFNRCPRLDKLKTYCKSLPELLFLDLFYFIEKPFEMASRRNDSVVKGSKSHQTCSTRTFYPLSLCRWEHTCDIGCWGLRQQLSEYSCFLPNWCPEIVWWKLTVFRSLVRNHCQASDWHCINVQLMSPTWQLENLLQIFAWIAIFRLVWLFWKTIWNG